MAFSGSACDDEASKPCQVEPPALKLQQIRRPHEGVCEQLSNLADDRAWCLKRDWTDQDFQAGEEANNAQLQEYEDMLIERLKRSCVAMQFGNDVEESKEVLACMLDPALARAGVQQASESVRFQALNDPEVLGSALDIVGAYLKNYQVDKAGRICETVMPICRKRGGLWELKVLNHLATVRMKQARPADALEILQEVDSIVGKQQSEQEREEAWEFWETVYRNFGWVLSSLDRQEEAITYIERAVQVKEQVGKSISWFDLWDLGRLKSVTALRHNDAKSIEEASKVVTRALWLHREAEPKDLVMRAKIWHTIGECSFALGYLAEKAAMSAQGGKAEDVLPNGPAHGREAPPLYRKALKCFREAHKLFKKTEGPLNPLTGTEAEAVSWTLMKLDEVEEAKEFLLNALEAKCKQQSGWGDTEDAGCRVPALVQATQLVERVLDAHRRSDDRAGLVRYFAALEALCAHVCARLQETLSKERVDAPIYEKLVSSCSMVMVASGADEGVAKSQQLLRKYLWKSPMTPQAQVCSEMMLSLGDGGAGAAGYPPTTGPGMKALCEALAKMQAGQS
eukprot:gnl/TRDRNA2_/TRDRNA2_85422_c0_seq1.p1 gnl/TRDRNA2_/TRDRNA2_85422_c0~~gnl/TRDRNA2_/TRDRNA2_85422_c0_seq1.p1  ORF type:complete len:568 (+),score=120.33 gnl/TRDRNA2_/TRDRNA2_85422_c0_seq1:93-1796(+)